MALFDWGNRSKTLEQGRAEGRAEGREQGVTAEREAWVVWLRKRDEAHARGEEFTEPSPAERAKESQVT